MSSYHIPKFHIYARIRICGKILLSFSLKEKFRKYDISIKRKHTKTNENMIFPILFTNFHKTEILFLCSLKLVNTNLVEVITILYHHQLIILFKVYMEGAIAISKLPRETSNGHLRVGV